MALQTGQNLRGQGASQRITDDDGREFVVAAGGVADTGGASGTGTAPGAGALAAVSGLAAGIYSVKGFVLLTGTAEVSTANLRIRVSGSNKIVLPTITGFALPIDVPRLTVPAAAGSIDIAVQAASTAGSIYTAFIAVTRVE